MSHRKDIYPFCLSTKVEGTNLYIKEFTKYVNENLINKFTARNFSSSEIGQNDVTLCNANMIPYMLRFVFASIVGLGVGGWGQQYFCRHNRMILLTLRCPKIYLMNFNFRVHLHHILEKPTLIMQQPNLSESLMGQH